MHLSRSEIQILLSVFPEGVIFLDLETTGLSPIIDKIIEIGAIKLTSRGEIHVFDKLVYPQIQIPEASTLIHNITNEMVKDAPTIDQILPEFLNFLETYPLVAQNAKFDIGFLVFSMHKKGMRFPPSRIYDSSRFARKALPELKSFGLLVLTKYFNITLDNHHRALEDGLACLKMVCRCFELSQKMYPTSQIRSQGLLFQFDEFKGLTSMDIPQHLQSLIPRLVKQEILEIEYRGGSYQGKFRPVRIVSFMPLPQGIVLYAFCFISNIYKSFSLKRIKSIRALKISEQEKWGRTFHEVTGHKP